MNGDLANLYVHWGRVGPAGAEQELHEEYVTLPRKQMTTSKFDFGTATSPVAYHYTRVTAQSAYSSALRHGWSAGTAYDADRDTGTELTRDLAYTQDATFAVDLVDGIYWVTLTTGDMENFAHDAQQVYLEGALRDTVSTVAGQVLTRPYRVEVTGGQLTLRLKDGTGSDWYATILALEITPE
ncbi:MAG: hypothetical protein WKF75_05140 [Singulisphaera sp.]